jgi:hypothetical protein
VAAPVILGVGTSGVDIPLILALYYN